MQLFAKVKSILSIDCTASQLHRRFNAWKRGNHKKFKEMLALADSDPSYLSDIVRFLHPGHMHVAYW